MKDWAAVRDWEAEPLNDAHTSIAKAASIDLVALTASGAYVHSTVHSVTESASLTKMRLPVTIG